MPCAITWDELGRVALWEDPASTRHVCLLADTPLGAMCLRVCVDLTMLDAHSAVPRQGVDLHEVYSSYLC